MLKDSGRYFGRREPRLNSQEPVLIIRLSRTRQESSVSSKVEVKANTQTGRLLYPRPTPTRSRDGNHEAIVKNIHELLVKLAWDFSPNQLDHLFGCFQKSWVGASKKQRDELLDFIRRLAEDDKEGIMASKTDLLFFVENLISAITSSARSCPSVMKRIIHLLRTLSVKQFPEFEDKVQFNSISGFIFLRFFALAILNPKIRLSQGLYFSLLNYSKFRKCRSKIDVLLIELVGDGDTIPPPPIVTANINV
uniref:Ras-GAP domain-containing protein n=1 Tax=Amphimedon queenslandica TaxID=400682 RepID=A0A1X7TIM1_AMPQE